MAARERRANAVEVGRRVRALRTALGLSQERFGQVAGIHRTAIGHLEQGRKDPRLTTLQRVAKALDVDLCVLLKELPPPPAPPPPVAAADPA